MSTVKLLIIFLLITQAAFSQLGKSDVIRHFDWVCYYPDSTIRSAFHIKDGQFNDYAVFFDSMGTPAIIGRFINGKRKGAWLKSDGGIIDYSESYANEYFPGCGTGEIQNIQAFQLTYRMLLAGKNNLIEYLNIK